MEDVENLEIEKVELENLKTNEPNLKKLNMKTWKRFLKGPCHAKLAR